MTYLIKEILGKVCATVEQIRIMDTCAVQGDAISPFGGLEELVARRVRGDLWPAVLYGFDTVDRVRKEEGGSILNAPGVFYLKLPARLSHIEKLLAEAANVRAPEKDAIDNQSFRHHAAQRIRCFKHTCDNIWLSMEMNANRAKRAQEDSPGTMLSALQEFRVPRIKRLSEEYGEVEPMAIRLGIKGAEQVGVMIEEVIGIIRKIQETEISPDNAIELAFNCVEKMKAAARSLAQAKELDKSD